MRRVLGPVLLFAFAALCSNDPHMVIGFGRTFGGNMQLRSSGEIFLEYGYTKVKYPGTPGRTVLRQMPIIGNGDIATHYITTPIDDTITWSGDWAENWTMTYKFDKAKGFSFFSNDNKMHSCSPLVHGQTDQIWLWFFGDSIRTRVNWIYVGKNKTDALPNYCTFISVSDDKYSNVVRLTEVDYSFHRNMLEHYVGEFDVWLHARSGKYAPILFPNSDTGSFQPWSVSMDIAIKRSKPDPNLDTVPLLTFPIHVSHFAHERPFALLPDYVMINFSKSDLTQTTVVKQGVIVRPQIKQQSKQRVLLNGRKSMKDVQNNIVVGSPLNLR